MLPHPITKRKSIVAGFNLFLKNLYRQVELAFQADEIAYIYGEMDEDGFYNVSQYFQ